MTKPCWPIPSPKPIAARWFRPTKSCATFLAETISRGRSLRHERLNRVEPSSQLLHRRRQLVGVMVARIAERVPRVAHLDRQVYIIEVARQADDLRVRRAPVQRQPARAPVAVER